jgi:hypothetical protein
MEETRESLRQESAEGLQESVQDLLREAKALESQQLELERKLPGNANPKKNDDSPSSADPLNPSSLRPDSEAGETTKPEDWKEQRQGLEKLYQRIQETVLESESSEPLLADALYDSFKDAKGKGIEQRLDQIPQMLSRGLDTPARQAAQEATSGITELRERLEKSSESVLGSEQQSLRRAINELERARGDLEDEIRERTGDADALEMKTSDREGSGQDRMRPDGDEERPGQQRGEGQRGESQSGESQSGGQQARDSRQGEPQRSDAQPEEAPAGEQQQVEQQQGEQRQDEQQQGEQTGGRQPGDRAQGNRPGTQALSGSGGERSTLDRIATEREFRAPLTGDDFLEWSDRIRDVEELVRDPELRAEAARIREAAREMRVDYKRHSKEPQWPLVKKMIAEPLDQLQQKVTEELLRKSAERNQIIPIDRDPVPNQFRRKLDKYYESLGDERAR